jgi:8-oxo-dGTP pyrophosphatase MutT (NUDIX family)
MIIFPGFTLCFLLFGDHVLMLHRRFPPTQGLWNGVGGHIEPGETPRQAVIREVAEETGYHIDAPVFAGLLTWEGFEIPPGAIAIFTARVPHQDFVTNHEGALAWKSRDWACTSPEVVDNIHVFLPPILAGEHPQHYHFRYQDGQRVEDVISPLPEDFDPDAPCQPGIELAEEQRGEYLLSFDKERLQLDVVEDFIINQAYWAKGRSRQALGASLQHSVCLGVYHQGLQVAFARLVTDEATFAWLADVFVDGGHRGRGLGKWLVEAACRYADLRGIERMVLITRDAHTLYETYGDFRLLANPGKWLSRSKPDEGQV